MHCGVAENPDASALAFDYIVDCFFETLACAGSELGGVFGLVSAYSGYGELQHRGQWHVHMTLWVRDSGTAAGIVELMQQNTDQFLDRLKRYVDTIMCATSIAPPCGVPAITTNENNITSQPEPAVLPLPVHWKNCPKRTKQAQLVSAENGRPAQL